MSPKYLIFIGMVCFAGGCSIRPLSLTPISLAPAPELPLIREETPSQEVLGRAPEEVVKKTNDEIKQSLVSKQKGTRSIFFGHLEIIDQIELDAPCRDTLSYLDHHQDKPMVQWSEDRLEILSKEVPIRYGFNFDFLSIGYDQVKYSFTSWDGKIPPSFPYDFSVKWISPSTFIIRWFHYEGRIDLTKTPVLSFVTEEKRSECVLKHHLNIFGDRFNDYSYLSSVSDLR